MHHPELTTPRLLLRGLALADTPDIMRLAGDRDVASTTVHIPHPYEPGMAETWIATVGDRFERGEAATFAIRFTVCCGRNGDRRGGSESRPYGTVISSSARNIMVRSRSNADHRNKVLTCFSTLPSHDTVPLVTTRTGSSRLN